MHLLRELFAANRGGKACGIYSVCSAHPIVLKAAILQAKKDHSVLLVEATANQVNQFGGYTGMQPADFIRFVQDLAEENGFGAEGLLFGGDHLGPVCWTDKPAAEAMTLCKGLIQSYVEAGFEKIHLDTSMPCADDPQALSDEVIAERAAILCEIAEQTSKKMGRDLCYVIGTEVPPPGGVEELEEHLAPTPVTSVMHTLEAHKAAFSAKGLEESSWQKVVAMVVQPGVEFDNSKVHDFVPQLATELSAAIESVPRLVFEAHSTDYQSRAALCELVQGHFAILKVGPALTFALREGLFALAHIEEALIAPERCSDLRARCAALMLEQPKYWQKFYPNAEQQPWLRFFSYSDRIRYYWNQPELKGAVDTLFANLLGVTIPLPLLSQYLPLQYQAVRAGQLQAEAEALLIHKIADVLNDYAQACHFQN